MKWFSLLLLLVVGCAARFDGEWVETRTPGHGQSVTSGEPRMAISFCPPSLVRVGLVVEKMDVVDANSVQEAGYFLFDGWEKAQLGSMVAKVDGKNDMVTVISGGTERKFTRVKGKSIFPPRIVLYPWG